MREIILKAIEGGYSFEGKTADQIIATRCEFEVLLDPKFFQALGKACGWEYTQSIMKITATDPKEREEIAKEWNVKPDWKIYALRFHEINLTEGWYKAVEYLVGVGKIPPRGTALVN